MINKQLNIYAVVSAFLLSTSLLLNLLFTDLKTIQIIFTIFSITIIFLLNIRQKKYFSKQLGSEPKTIKEILDEVSKGK